MTWKRWSEKSKEGLEEKYIHYDKAMEGEQREEIESKERLVFLDDNQEWTPSIEEVLPRMETPHQKGTNRVKKFYGQHYHKVFNPLMKWKLVSDKGFFREQQNHGMVRSTIDHYGWRLFTSDPNAPKRN